jgi:hypothetical protein
MKKITLLMTMLLCAVAGFAQVNLNQGLIAYYPYTGNANDASGNGANGTVTGASLIVDRFGNANSAYSLLNNEYITSTVNYDSDSSFSVVFWFNTGQPTVSSLFFLWRGDDGSPSPMGEQAFFRLESTGTVCKGSLEKFQSMPVPCSDNASAQASAGVYNNSVWHLGAIVKDGNLLTLYINGVVAATSTISWTCGATINTNYETLTIGSDSYDGGMDDIMIYNRAITATEVDSINSLSSGFVITTIDKVNSSFDIALYPNPTNTSTSINFPYQGSYTVLVTDLTGRLVYSLQSQNTQNVDINTAAWPAGIYMVQVRDEKSGMSVTKLVKE